MPTGPRSSPSAYPTSSPSLSCGRPPIPPGAARCTSSTPAAYAGTYGRRPIPADVPRLSGGRGGRRFLGPRLAGHLLQPPTGAQRVTLDAGDLGARNHAALFLFLLLDIA